MLQPMLCSVTALLMLRVFEAPEPHTYLCLGRFVVAAAAAAAPVPSLRGPDWFSLWSCLAQQQQQVRAAAGPVPSCLG